MKVKKMFNRLDKNYWYILGIVLFIILPQISNNVILGNDLYYHISNLYAMNDNLSIKHFVLFPQKVLPVIANNLGYGSGIFYPKLAHIILVYIYQVYEHLGISNMMYTVKTFCFFIILLSGIFMYVYVKSAFGRKNMALLASAFYITYPYFCVDLFYRNALAECMMFVFIPIVFLGLHYLMERDLKKFIILFIIGFVGAINSHLVLSVYLAGFVVIFALINYKKIFTLDRIKVAIIACVFILIFIFPFILPLLEHKIFGNYVVFEDGIMFSLETVNSSRRSLRNLFSYGNYNTLSYLAVIFSFLALINYKKTVFKDRKKILIAFTLISCICLLLTLNFIDWKWVPKFMLNIQFSWRLYLFFMFFISILGASVIDLFKGEMQKVILLFSIVLLLFNYNYVENPKIYGRNLGYLHQNNIDISFWGAGWQSEYYPIASYRNKDYIDKLSDKSVSVKRGKCEISSVKSRTPYLEFDIKNNNTGCVVEVPRLYYLGYNIYINNKKINYFENKNGLIEFKTNKGGKVKISYNGTILYKISLFIVWITILILIVYKIKIERKKKNEKNINNNTNA